jgi:Uma2 family endonuclease
MVWCPAASGTNRTPRIAGLRVVDGRPILLFDEEVPSVPTVVTDDLLEHRRRLGLDRRDERWAGEWRIVNPPKNWHARVQRDLLVVLIPRAAALGLEPLSESGVFGAADDFRVPDVVFVRPDEVYGDDEGWARAELVVEIRSPGDDSYRKLPFYAERVREVLILHRDRTPELYRGTERVEPAEDGSVPSETLAVTFAPVATDDGPRLRITWDGDAAEV